MDAPSCYVVAAGEMVAAVETLGWAFAGAAAAIWLAGWDWHALEWRVRRYLRRRRLQRIRAARMFGAA